MRYTADTWFLLKIIDRDENAVKIEEEILEGKGRLVIPTIVISELVRETIRKGKIKIAEEILDALQTSTKIFVADLNQAIAKEAGRVGISFNVPLVDSVILATAILFDHKNILTVDEHYKTAERKGEIKRVFW